MSDTPLADAVHDIPKNTLLVEGEATSQGDASGQISLEREKGSIAGGVVAGASKKKGWFTGFFFRKEWK